MDLSNVYKILRYHPTPDGEPHIQVIGKFYLDDKHFQVLEDHDGFMEHFQGQTPAKTARELYALSRSMYFKVINSEDIRQGKHPDLIPEVETSNTPLSPDSIFHYHRTGLDAPQTLEFRDGKSFLDGHSLEDIDLQALLDNVRQGAASLKYAPPSGLEKSEEVFMSLAKIEPHLDAALSGLRTAVKLGHVHPDVLRTVTNEIFKDSMVPKMGNKKAYEDFLTRPKQGVHVRMDGVNFGAINKQFGFETGNKAIKQMFEATREALDESVGRKHAKAFRIGGDEGHVFLPSMEHAALFARSLRSKLEQIPPIGGVHPLAFSLGFGTSPEQAEAAMIDAKVKHKQDNCDYRTGGAKTHAASRVPGFEGHIPL